jgi:tRNA-splicing ligase RtcB (3'-phosphate/5'-hydroxy nucleic acid ligase)
MPVRQTLEEAPVPVLVWTADVEASARQQLLNVARLPVVHHHVAAMPDVHTGIGATVGSVIATCQAIIPAAVGVDIGCGMIATRLSLAAADVEERSLKRAYDRICRDVPVGFAQYPENRAQVQRARALENPLAHLTRRHPEVLKRMGRQSNWVRQLGTLGGGNHFIELCLDESQQLWVMLHSGSRGIGNAIGSHFIELARRDMEHLLGQLPDRNLAYLEEGSPHFADYVEAVTWAQRYASENRAAMLALILAALAREFPPFTVTEEAVNCHHNYVQQERHYGQTVWVTRKGAIRAGAGDLGIIPGSMGTRSYIVRGKGSPESFESCAHGAGRRMSRTAANHQFREADLARLTEGVLCRKDKGVIDEIPAAYKDIDEVMSNQSDLVSIVHTLKQIACIKG